jgi:hypothetical protein
MRQTDVILWIYVVYMAACLFLSIVREWRR